MLGGVLLALPDLRGGGFQDGVLGCDACLQQHSLAYTTRIAPMAALAYTCRSGFQQQRRLLVPFGTGLEVRHGIVWGALGFGAAKVIGNWRGPAPRFRRDEGRPAGGVEDCYNFIVRATPLRGAEELVLLCVLCQLRKLRRCCA